MTSMGTPDSATPQHPEDEIYDAALSIKDSRSLDPRHPGTWFCRCGAGWFGEAAVYPQALHAHALFRLSADEPGRDHDPGLARFRPDTDVAR